MISLQNEVLPDRFVVCGESYKDLRELLAEIVIGKDVTALTEKVQVNFFDCPCYLTRCKNSCHTVVNMLYLESHFQVLSVCSVCFHVGALTLLFG